MSLLAKYAKTKAVSTPAPAAQVETAVQIHKEVEVLAPAPKPVATHNPAAKAAPSKTVEVQAPAPEVKTRALSSYDPFALITGEISEDANAVLEMIMARENEVPQFDGVFPLVKLGKGNSGGSWTFASNVDSEAAGVLPVATKSFNAFFLGVRIYGVAWNQAMNNDKAESGEKDKPAWKVQVSSGDRDLFQAALNAGECYQYTPGAEKSKFDGLGHFRPGLEFLFYRKGVIFAVRLPDHYSSTQRALQALSGVMAGLGGMRGCPVTVTPYSTDEKGAKAWKCHSIRIEFAANAEGKELAADFASIRNDLMADETFKADFSAWNQTDLTEEAASALRAIAAMKKG